MTSITFKKNPIRFIRFLKPHFILVKMNCGKQQHTSLCIYIYRIVAFSSAFKHFQGSWKDLL
uniref:Uncharacterized protein n=1 Tax=Anguilla anguilla TaxID=7936 RepID=A0A0E9WS13_ANGAN